MLLLHESKKEHELEELLWFVVIAEKDPCKDQVSPQPDECEICVICIMNDLEMGRNALESIYVNVKWYYELFWDYSAIE